jgi:hypothetical protein
MIVMVTLVNKAIEKRKTSFERTIEKASRERVTSIY